MVRAAWAAASPRFEHARDYGEFFKAVFGATIAARKNAVANGRDAEFDAALDGFCNEWDRGGNGQARFEGVPRRRRDAALTPGLSAADCALNCWIPDG